MSIENYQTMDTANNAMVIVRGTNMAKKVEVKAGTSEDGGEPEKQELVGISMKVPRSLHDRLRKIAFEKRRPMTEFIIKGVEDILKKEGY